MSSLLTKELESYNNDNNLDNYYHRLNYSKNLEKLSKNTILHNIDNKINLDIIKSDNIKINSLKGEYRLNSNFFNPAKNSSPNEWQNRLQQRINSYNLK